MVLVIPLLNVKTKMLTVLVEHLTKCVHVLTNSTVMKPSV